jgi:hypothetical protein
MHLHLHAPDLVSRGFPNDKEEFYTSHRGGWAIVDPESWVVGVSQVIDLVDPTPALPQYPFENEDLV